MDHGCTLTLVDFEAEGHAALMARLLDEVEWTTHMKSRQTASMGVPYNYGGNSYPVTPWHPAVKALADRLRGTLGFQATNCLLNLYTSGQNSMGWHSDDVSILEPGTGIGILSLGATRTLKLRRTLQQGFHYEDMALPGGTLLLMSAQMQGTWRHAIRREVGSGMRMSLSFRHIVRWPEVPPPVPPRV
jgi:alkylated DNA repair dioxygenase AlkB